MLAQSLAPRVRVNAVSPGLTLPSLDQTAAEFATVARENLLQRPIDAAAIGDAVAYLLEAPSVAGQNLFVDDGQRFLPRGSRPEEPTAELQSLMRISYAGFRLTNKKHRSS